MSYLLLSYQEIDELQKRTAKRQAVRDRRYDPTGMLLPTAQRKRKVETWTDLAKKYSQPIGQLNNDHHILRNTRKSGLTPLPSPTWAPWNDKGAATQSRNDYLRYQRGRNAGFTSAELVAMESFAAFDDGIASDPLTKELHSAFQRDRWNKESEMPRHQGVVSILGDYDGFWMAENDLVWNLMLPSLRLASAALTNFASYPWLDTLFHGTLRTIDMQGKATRYTIEERSATVRTTPEQHARLQTKIISVYQSLGLNLWTRHTNSDNGLPGSQPLWGQAEFKSLAQPWNRQISIRCAIQLLQPLLRDDLTQAERVATQFIFASFLLHESAHAIWLWRRYIQNTDVQPTTSAEPFMGDDQLNELGWSFEYHIWGASPGGMTEGQIERGGPGLPLLGIMASHWATECHSV